MKKQLLTKTKTKLFLIFLISLLISCTETKEEAIEKPNILFIMMDDLGYGQFGVHNENLQTADFDPYFVSLVKEYQGYDPAQALEFSKIAIPTINSLANEGVVFTRAYTTSSLCGPSRLGIATGTQQNRFGIYTNLDCSKKGITPGSHLVEKLQDLGYANAHIGKWHIGQKDSQILKDIYQKHGISTDSIGSDKQENPEIIQAISNSGYFGSVIKEHNPLQNGFDYYYGYNDWASQFYNSNLVWENYEHAGKQKGYNTDVFTDKAIDFIEKQVAHKKRFFLQLHYHAVHDSLEPKAPDKYFNKFNSDSYDLNNFYAHMNGVDANIEKMVTFLKSKGVYENTLIIFTSDNGAMAGGSYNGNKTGSPLPGNAPFSGHKGNYYQGGIRVPLIAHWPKGITKPQVSNALISTMDILPTTIDAAGGELPRDIDGRSVLPILKGESEVTIHDHLVWSGTHATAWGFLVNKTTKNHSSERYFAPPAWVVTDNMYLLRYVGKIEPDYYKEFPNGHKPVYELYNIEKDPSETRNLASEFPEIVEKLKKIYQIG